MSMIFSSDSKYKICQHGRYKYACKFCGGKHFCEHGRHTKKCKQCSDPIPLTIKHWLSNSKVSDKKKKMFDIVNFIDKCFCENLIEEYPNCYYCSIELQYKIYQSNLGTIERLKNSIGHIKSNCVISCRTCNCKKVGDT